MVDHHKEMDEMNSATVGRGVKQDAGHETAVKLWFALWPDHLSRVLPLEKKPPRLHCSLWKTDDPALPPKQKAIHNTEAQTNAQHI